MKHTVARLGATLVVLLLSLQAHAAGMEHPDNGTIAMGRGGAWAANPSDGMAMQYNPAGFVQQEGLRLHIDGKLAFQGLTFDPSNPEQGDAVSNQHGAFLIPGFAISYGLGSLGPLSGLTVALGATGPSAVGKLDYATPGAEPSLEDDNFANETGAGRYALLGSDYFIAFYSASVAAGLFDLVNAGITLQLVHGTAQFSQAVWSGQGAGYDPIEQAAAEINVESGFIPAAVLGATVTPTDDLDIGVSFRPRVNFTASGTLDTTSFTPGAKLLGVEQVGNAATMKLVFPDVYRLGILYRIFAGLEVEADFVFERWSQLQEIVIEPDNISMKLDDAWGVELPLDDIILPKKFKDAWSVRLGAEWNILDFLAVRGGFIYETSAIRPNYVSVDFNNWGRTAVSLGASINVLGYAWIDAAYARHMIPSQTVTNSKTYQVTAPCLAGELPAPLTGSCPEASPVGNGTYTSSLDLLSVSVRVPISDIISGD